MTKKPQKGAGRQAGSGNVTIDLGEEIDKKLRSATLAGKGRGHRPVARSGGYRPGMFGGGYRPWYASSASRWSLGAREMLPRTMDTWTALTGIALGTIGSRALIRVTPDIVTGTRSRLAHEAIAFGVGLIPLLVKKNSMTMGVALPGVVFLGGAVVDYVLDALGVPRRALSGATGSDASYAARQKLERLAEVQGRIHQQTQRSPLPRVVAQPTFA